MEEILRYKERERERLASLINYQNVNMNLEIVIISSKEN